MQAMKIKQLYGNNSEINQNQYNMLRLFKIFIMTMKIIIEKIYFMTNVGEIIINKKDKGTRNERQHFQCWAIEYVK